MKNANALHRAFATTDTYLQRPLRCHSPQIAIARPRIQPGIGIAAVTVSPNPINNVALRRKSYVTSSSVHDQPKGQPYFCYARFAT